MTMLSHDKRSRRPATPARVAEVGLAFAVVSAVTFGTSGAFGKGLLDNGWSAGAVVAVRIWVAALVLLPFGLASLRGRWSLLRANLPTLLAYGALAVAGAQYCYFNAIGHLQVGLALLIEYTAPLGVTAWLWLRHGHRPGRRTAFGALWCALGLALVLDVLSGGTVSGVGLAWAFASMVGASAYFVISAREDTGLPPLVLGAGGLLAGALTLSLGALVGLVPLHANTGAVTYTLGTVVWWLPLLGLGVVSAAVAYGTGIAAGRRLGSRLASFVALLEVLAAVGFAWLLLGESPGVSQVVGGVLILVGVVVVKLGEGEPVRPGRVSARPGGG